MEAASLHSPALANSAEQNRMRPALAIPDAIAAQNCRCSSRPATGGRPGDNNGGRPDRAERRFRLVIVTPSIKVLRRPLEFTQDLLKQMVSHSGGPVPAAIDDGFRMLARRALAHMSLLDLFKLRV